MAEPGDRIGAYEVVRFIARGGMATVYEAFQSALQRSVALKQLDLRSSEPNHVQRFIHESRLSASFNHSNIVTVFDFFEHDGVPFIAMEYLPRGSLRPLVGKLSQAQVFGVLQWMLAGLAHAEEHGVAHRDLKPENLLITRTGEIKIADFGIAKAYHSTTAQLSATGAALGTPTYMAPEQAMAQPVGPYTDLYAVGIITYEMLNGGPPFVSGGTPMALLYKHVSEPPPPLTGQDPRIADWVARLLEKEPAARPPDAKQAWRELEPTIVDLLGPFWRNEATLGEVPRDEYVTMVHDREVGLATPGPEPPPKPEPPPPEPEPQPESPPLPAPTPDAATTIPPTPVAPAPPAEGPQRGSRRGLVIGGVAVVAAVIVGAVIALGGGGDDNGGSGGGTPPASKAAAPFDFDGDGMASITIGLPGAGTVMVDDATLEGPGGFGTAVASADFNHDGKADLAIGAPKSSVVTVFYGGDDGLGDARKADLGGDDGFGTALVAGDFNGDGFGDLAVGAPGGDGTIRIELGGSKGLSEQGEQTIEPPDDLKGAFGSVLAAGDINNDGALDLAEAAPGGGGHASYCAGGNRGPTACSALASDDGGPSALAIGDVNADKFADIVEGLPRGGENAKPAGTGPGPGPAGLVRIVPGSADGPGGDALTVTQNTQGVAGSNEALDRFGAAVAVEDLDGDGKADLVVGAPGEDTDTGRVTIVRGPADGSATRNVPGYGRNKDATGVDIPVRAGARFGAAVQLLDLDGDDHTDLIASAAGQSEVVMLPGTDKGIFTKAGSAITELHDGATEATLGPTPP